ncbi:tRNA synthetases class I, catalytic domain-containing protein [Scheffersomyces amazonensis]|uniref:tRNA synthetases class I, catalytic domain-containing protein n=1 Tax=Scheffersomyces amazonensis TaxID=1078765 RepID=UPI00315E02E6
MSFILSVATKATAVAYPVLLAVKIIDEIVDEVSIPIEFIDEKSVDPTKADIGAKLVTPEGKTYETQLEILTYLSEKFPSVVSDAKESQKWAEFALNHLYIKNFKVLSTDLETLDAHLNLRSFVVGNGYSLADYAVWGALRANALMGSIIKNEVYINISRWYNLLASDKRFENTIEFYTKSVNELRKSLKAASTGGKKETHKANFDIDLPGAKIGEVVTRFPPEPSGYLHIGHAKAAILNEYFAHNYKGKLIIRFDDTNPTKEKEEFQDSIIEDLALLGIKGDKVTYSSDYFDTMYELAIQMIKDGNAYCDDTPLEKMREQRMVGEPSERRNRSIEENLTIFTQEMKNGTEEGLKNCLRAKIDYTAANKTLRDPVLYRCNLTPHHRTGTAWKMYPLYDFCVPVVDSIEGVTHALRTNEYRDRNPQYEWIQNALKLRHVNIWDFGRVNFVRTLLSKRKLQWFVDKKYVANWDDPRFPTVRGVRRRGMTVEGLRNFIISQGPSKNIINLDWSVIWALNKKVIDPIAPRFTAVDKENAVVVNLDGPAEPTTEQKPKHKKNAEVGLKSVIYANKVLIDQADAVAIEDGEEITFMDWGNVIVEKVHKEGDVVKSIDAKLHLDGDFRKTSKKLTWLADTSDKVEVDLVDFDHLITKDKLEEEDNFEDFLTPETEFHTKAYADLNVRSLKESDVIQFERKGYYRVDKPYEQGKEVVLYTIPDGKTVSRYGAKK